MPSGVFSLKQQVTAIRQGAWTNQSPLAVNYLVVAGGGAGGDNANSSNGNGGGGAGGLLQGSIGVTTGSAITVTIGAGSGRFGTAGSDSVFGSITSKGGGTGARFNNNGSYSGGSGGGGSSGSSFLSGAQGTVGQGNAGGTGLTTNSGGGGGGAGTVGLNAVTNRGGNGGSGVASDISGTRTTYAGGGGGGALSAGTVGAGGVGGGGAGNGTDAGANTGGGGGGSSNNGNAGTGGSGIVIVSYPGTTQWFTGGTLSYANGNVIHTFYSSGTLTPTAASNYVNTDYQITRSLRFNSADSAYLNRTPASATNRKTWTWSGWVKRSALGASTHFFGAYSGTGSDTTLFTVSFNSSDQLDISAFTQNWRVTSQVFRDVGSWYHIVIVFDTTQATAGDRVKLYVNGSQVTAFGTSNNPTQNTDYVVNNTVAHYIGVNAFTGNIAYFNGYVTEVNFIDGQALTPSSFGYYSPTTGVWSPLKFVGTYGTNGFYLNFSDNSNTTAATLGKDYSGNGNNWTPNNFSVTAGAGNDSLVDSPTAYGTDTGAGGEVRGNYATLNPLIKAGVTLTNGNLNIAASGDNSTYSTIETGKTGKWYAEFTPTATNSVFPWVGTRKADSVLGGDGSSFYPGVQSGGEAGYLNNGNKYVAGSQSSYGNTFAANDVIGIAVDCDNGAIYFSKNGTFQNSGSPTSGSSKTGAAATWTGASQSFFIGVCANGSSTGVINFGQRPFAYTAPSGFKALCTQNLPTPTVVQGDDYFNTVLYTGTGSSNAQTGVGFQPDFVWIKGRSGATDHGLYDAVRGVQKQLESNTTTAETTETTGLTAFGTDGFTVGALAQLNTNTATYVAWNWKANGAGSSNTAGSITSTVSANTTSGFSVVKWNGSGNATIGHGLGVAPSMYIVKLLDQTSQWYVFFKDLGAGKYMQLNLTAGAATDTAIWQNTAPTSSVFYIGSGINANNMITYCFAEVTGYSKFGSYTGNGSADGPFVYCGFRPRWIMYKRTDTAGENWQIRDTARDPYNVMDKNLRVNLSDAETTFPTLDAVSNGFKLRGTDTGFNANGGTYIYAAFAENPFKYALAR